MSNALSFVRPDGSLVPIRAAKQAIARLADPRDADDFARKAEAAKSVCDKTDERRDYFGELAIWASVRLGELLASLPKQNGSRGIGKKVEYHCGTPLSEIGLSKNVSSRSQKLAKGKDIIPQYIADCRSKGKEITKGGALMAAKRHLRGEALKAKADDALPADFKIVATPDVITCDALITDPPYGITGEPWEPENVEHFTRDWLSRWDTCGATWFVSFFSQAGLWGMRRWMDDELTAYEFHHLAIWHYPNGMGHKAGQVLKESWEPVFIYKRRGSAAHSGEWDWHGLNNLDCIREAAPRPGFEGEAEQRHPCQKPVRVMKLLVTAFCHDGGLVVDPFCGSGTTGVAARQAGRRFYGIETTASYRKLASARINSFGGSQ